MAIKSLSVRTPESVKGCPVLFSDGSIESLDGFSYDPGIVYIPIRADSGLLRYYSVHVNTGYGFDVVAFTLVEADWISERLAALYEWETLVDFKSVDRFTRADLIRRVAGIRRVALELRKERALIRARRAIHPAQRGRPRMKG